MQRLGWPVWGVHIGDDHREGSHDTTGTFQLLEKGRFHSSFGGMMSGLNLWL